MTFPWSTLRGHSEQRDMLLDETIFAYQQEGFVMPYTMEDFRHDYVKKHFKELTPEERREAMKDLTLEELLEGRSPEEIEQFLEKLRAERSSGQPKKRRRK